MKSRSIRDRIAAAVLSILTGLTPVPVLASVPATQIDQPYIPTMSLESHGSTGTNEASPGAPSEQGPLSAATALTATPPSNPGWNLVEVPENTQSTHQINYDVFRPDGTKAATIIKERTFNVAMSDFSYASLSLPDVSKDGNYIVHAVREWCTRSSSSCSAKQVLQVYSPATGQKTLNILLKNPNTDGVAEARFDTVHTGLVSVRYTSGTVEYYRPDTGEKVTPAVLIPTASNPNFFIREKDESVPGQRKRQIYEILNSAQQIVAVFIKSQSFPVAASTESVDAHGILPDVSADGKYAIHAAETWCTVSSSSCTRKQELLIRDLTTNQLKKTALQLPAVDWITGAQFVENTIGIIKINYRSSKEEYYNASTGTQIPASILVIAQRRLRSGEKIARITPNGTSWTIMNHNALGQRTTQYGYSAKNLLESETSWIYNAAGQNISIGQTTYHPNGRVASRLTVQQPINGLPGIFLRYRYDANGRLLGVEFYLLWAPYVIP